MLVYTVYTQWFKWLTVDSFTYIGDYYQLVLLYWKSYTLAATLLGVGSIRRKVTIMDLTIVSFVFQNYRHDSRVNNQQPQPSWHDCHVCNHLMAAYGHDHHCLLFLKTMDTTIIVYCFWKPRTQPSSLCLTISQR